MTGESVIATMPDKTTATANVLANSRNNDPVRPPWNPMGAYTVASVMVIAMIGPSGSRAAIWAASMRDCPSRTCRSTFSTTTMASSTTSPTDNTMARSVRRLRLKPNTAMNNAAPINDTGIATSGTRAVRTDPMNRKTTTATIRIVSDHVLVISVSAFRMNIVLSQTSFMSISFGRVGRIRSISSRSRRPTSISFTPGTAQMPR